MDAAAETSAALLASPNAAASSPNACPELSRSQTTLDPPAPALEKRKSLRMRPTEALEQQHAKPSFPLRPTSSSRQQLQKKASMFSLFTKPKVEKVRAYAEPTQDPPSAQRAMSLTHAGPAKTDTVVRVQDATPEQSRLRPMSSKSFSSKKARLYTSREPMPSMPSDSRPRQFELPPLFQVWPQTTKSATLEVSTGSAAAPVQKFKPSVTEVLFGSTHDMLSNAMGYRAPGETRASSPRSGSISGLTLPQKVVVLTTSGCLLQYAKTGANDRLPERVLLLGKDSAAFASDLIPGKHHVLQVSHAIDSDGVSVTSTHSLFSRFNMRRPPASQADTVLLVMSGADELNEWMTAVKKEIEAQGGKRARSDSPGSRPKSRQPPQPLQLDLDRMPSVSHRYQVKRDPSGPSPLISPKLDTFPSPPLPSPRLDTEQEQRPSEQPTTAVTNESDAESPKADAASIKTRLRAPSDCPSVSSSTALSVDNHQLEKLRNSVRMSHTSTAATSITAFSRTNSMISSPSDQPRENTGCGGDIALPKSPYRTLSSFSLAKRKAALPLPLKQSYEVMNNKGSMQQQRLAVLDSAVDSPVVGFNSPTPAPLPALPNNRLSVAKSTPDLRSKAEIAARRDSKLPMPQMDERPESFIADLPDPTLWAGKTSPTVRMSSSIPFPPLLETTKAQPHQRTSSGTMLSPTSRPLRGGSNSFSLPNRVRPLDSQPCQPPKRSLSDEQEERVLSPVPAVHTLTAKVDLTTRTRIDASLIPTRKSSTSGSPPITAARKRTPSAKLSLFPTTQLIPPPIFPQVDGLRRSPSAAAMSSVPRPQVQIGSANSTRHTRPASVQDRAEPASLNAANCNDNSSDDTTVRTQSPTIAAANQNIEPSNSVATMRTINKSTSPRSDISNVSHKATLIPVRTASFVDLPPSRPRKSPRISAQGINVANLGPPSPPPSTPLPNIPTVERSMSKDRLSIIRAGTPIGIAIGEALEEAAERRGSTNIITNIGIAVPEEEEEAAAAAI